MTRNRLYYGDNLAVLREYVADESVDLIYLDPPFNSRQDYNVLFAEKDGTRSSSQFMAFEDTWEWNQESMGHFSETRSVVGANHQSEFKRRRRSSRPLLRMRHSYRRCAAPESQMDWNRCNAPGDQFD